MLGGPQANLGQCTIIGSDVCYFWAKFLKRQCLIFPYLVSMHSLNLSLQVETEYHKMAEPPSLQILAYVNQNPLIQHLLDMQHEQQINICSVKTLTFGFDCFYSMSLSILTICGNIVNALLYMCVCLCVYTRVCTHTHKHIHDI